MIFCNKKPLWSWLNISPTLLHRLKSVKGFGKTRIAQFGEEILEIIVNYRNENGISTEPEIEEELQKPKKEKI